MRHVQKFLALSRTEQWLLAKALVTVGTVRLALWLLPYRLLNPLLTNLRARWRPHDRCDLPAPDRVAWAVATAARCVPSATCLTQALAAQLLLVGCGEESEVHIGVERNARNRIAGHAWLTARGRVVLGDQSLERYLPLTQLAQGMERRPR